MIRDCKLRQRLHSRPSLKVAKSQSLAVLTTSSCLAWLGHKLWLRVAGQSVCPRERSSRVPWRSGSGFGPDQTRLRDWAMLVTNILKRLIICSLLLLLASLRHIKHAIGIINAIGLGRFDFSRESAPLNLFYFYYFLYFILWGVCVGMLQLWLIMLTGQLAFAMFLSVS